MTSCRARVPWTHLVLMFLALLLSYARDTLGIRTESFVARIGLRDARSIALVTALGFGLFRTVTVFVEVEMRVVGLGGTNWPVGRVRECS